MRTQHIVVALAALALAGSVTGQQKEASSARGYHEAVAFEGKMSVKTRDGERPINIVIKKLRVDGGTEPARVPLPERGFVIFQLKAGAVDMRIGESVRRPLEGEWLVVALPQTVTLAVKDDSVLIDAIILAE